MYTYSCIHIVYTYMYICMYYVLCTMYIGLYIVIGFSMCSIVAVGGTDDRIHILQRKQSPSVRPSNNNTQSSLFSYCEYSTTHASAI